MKYKINGGPPAGMRVALYDEENIVQWIGVVEYEKDAAVIDSDDVQMQVGWTIACLDTP
jgi:hypothetical protein